VQSPKTKSRRQQFLAKYPTCYLCSGLNPSTTIDHVPPKACFPRGYAPEGFEFPACDSCNKLSRADDKIFGFWTMALNFDSARTISAEDRKRIIQLMTDIAKESSQDIAGLQRAVPISMLGRVATPRPVAFEMKTPDSFSHAAELISIKLTHALYFRETKKYLNPAHRFTASIYQPQVGGTEQFTSYAMSLLPKVSIGVRTNIKDYGDRFGYRSGYKEEEDSFFYATQFGRGLIVWGLVCGPNIERPTSGPLADMTWMRGACGAMNSSPIPNSRHVGLSPDGRLAGVHSSNAVRDGAGLGFSLMLVTPASPRLSSSRRDLLPTDARSFPVAVG
jgi:hypothetical protein